MWWWWLCRKRHGDLLIIHYQVRQMVFKSCHPPIFLKCFLCLLFMPVSISFATCGCLSTCRKGGPVCSWRQCHLDMPLPAATSAFSLLIVAEKCHKTGEGLRSKDTKQLSRGKHDIGDRVGWVQLALPSLRALTVDEISLAETEIFNIFFVFSKL